MTVRPATDQDARPIASIHVHAWKEAYRGLVPADYLSGLSVEKRERGWQPALAAGHPCVWVAENGGEIVGWVAAAASRDSDAGSTVGEIWGIYVAPEHWRRGVGQMLCDAAERHLRDSGFIDATLWVLADNERAREFYRARGFVVDNGQKQAEFAGEALLEIRMRKPLSA